MSYSDKFANAMKVMLVFEGKVLENDPDDPGGITCCGITKRYQPNWSGWNLIDLNRINDSNYKKELLKDDGPVMEAVFDYYYNQIWKKYNLDKYHQELSFEIFDQTINPGPGGMGKNLQRCLNSFNWQNKYGEDLIVDGSVGPKTLSRLDQIVNDNRTMNLVYALNCMQGNYYVEVTERNKNQRKYFAGWMTRTIMQFTK